jgi:hypothetical protein
VAIHYLNWRFLHKVCLVWLLGVSTSFGQDLLIAPGEEIKVLEQAEMDAAPFSNTGETSVELLPAEMDATNDPTWKVGYDRGFFLRGVQNDESFELKTNMRLQFRYVTFSRNADSWTNNAGVVLPIRDRQYFDIERARLVFSGHAFSPKVTYQSQFDFDTDSRHVASLLDGWVAWEYRDKRLVHFGKRKVPGTRNWILGAFDTRMVDRPISNEFFRPSRTVGIWFTGDPDPSFRYDFMIGQGYNTEGLTPQEFGNNFATAGSIYRDVIGNYGPLRPTDFEYHDELAVRLGMSAVASIEGTPGRQLEETDFLRLTDGTRITEPNALAPGATVESFHVYLLAVDAAYKYKGWSANAEYFVRSIQNLTANIPVPAVGLQHGFYTEGGFFVVPKRFELNSQYSFVTGDQGSANSYTTGFSYYPRGAPFLKMSMDGTYIDGSPVNSTATNILVGDKGFLFRCQWQALF